MVFVVKHFSQGALVHAAIDTETVLKVEKLSVVDVWMGQDARLSLYQEIVRWEFTLWTGLDYAGEDWSWRTFLEKLHFFLEFETAGDAFAWLEDGVHFILHHGVETNLEVWLGLRSCSLHQALETLNFEYQEELHWDYAIYHHHSFVRGNPGKITEILVNESSLLDTEKDMTMPSVAYSAALKPLEVRLSLSESNSQSWEVTVAKQLPDRHAAT